MKKEKSSVFFFLPIFVFFFENFKTLYTNRRKYGILEEKSDNIKENPMNEREIAEVRRTLRPERSTIPAVYGCYVNAEGQIIAKFCRSFALMGEEESEKYLSLFRRVLTGTPYRNLIDIPFSNSQNTAF